MCQTLGKEIAESLSILAKLENKEHVMDMRFDEKELLVSVI